MLFVPRNALEDLNKKIGFWLGAQLWRTHIFVLCFPIIRNKKMGRVLLNPLQAH